MRWLLGGWVGRAYWLGEQKKLKGVSTVLGEEVVPTWKVVGGATLLVLEVPEVPEESEVQEGPGVQEVVEELGQLVVAVVH